jgi:hypothetical protein
MPRCRAEKVIRKRIGENQGRRETIFNLTGIEGPSVKPRRRGLFVRSLLGVSLN